MQKSLKILIVVIVILASLALILWGVYRWFTHQDIPQTTGKLKAPGLNQPVEVLRDEFGVPHIYAQNPEDLFFTQGFIHAQERFWQMEFQRRTGAARLSEIFGEATLSTDKYLRQFGFYSLAQQAYDLMDDEAKKVINAYTAGVNAYISSRKPGQLALEFSLLGLQGVKYDIEPWSPADSLVWGEMLIFDQSDQLRTELRNISLLAAVGQEMYDDLLPAYRDDRPTIIPSEELKSQGNSGNSTLASMGEAEIGLLLSLGKQLNGAQTVPPELVDLGFFAAGGSNSFAISGTKTSSGKPLLANDPHMSINIPALWFEIGMHCQEKSAACIYNFRGFSLPGVPGILIGHNDRIAWGLTNASFDSEDVFIERLNPQNPNQYEVNGQWVDMEIRREEIKVRGKEEPVVIFVRSTRNGLVASDSMVSQKPFDYNEDQPQPLALVYAWTALEPVRSVSAVLNVIRAQNWEQFSEALKNFDAGKQNWLYADVDGNIGYILPGKIPIRAGGDGSLPVPGWNDDFIWKGYIPYEELPRVFNPAQGFIATANNPQIRYEDYPYLISTSHDRGQRAQRITEMILGDSDGITIQDMMAIQTDGMNLSALEIIPYLKELSFEDTAVSDARDHLLRWDGQMKMDSPEAALFSIFWVHLVQDTFNDQLPPDQYPGGGHTTSDTVYFLLQDASAIWWDNRATADIVESRDQILTKAFKDAFAEGTEKFGSYPGEWRWGDMHTITFTHATLGRSGISFIENIFNRGPFATNGGESVVQKTCWSVNLPYEVLCIPALRQIIDLGDLSNSRMIHSVGQSGHPMHPSYDNFIDAWRFFDYHFSNWLREDIEKGKNDLLILEPSS